jgi:hypothetical protein
MATATRKPTVARKAPTAKEPHGKASMTITIDNGTSSADYRVKPLPEECHSGIVKAYRLAKTTGGCETYFVSQHETGALDCSCPAQINLYKGNPNVPHCKHIKVLRTFGMIG